MNKVNFTESGFTLVEVMVASTIGAFVALVAVGTLRTVMTSNEIVDGYVNTAAELRFASNIIKRDLTNIYRDENVENTKLIGTTEDLGEYDTSYLVFYTLNRTKARSYEPEGDLYEVEYYLVQKEGTSSLMRRLWPNPNDEYEPGGILTAIAENIEYFEVRYFDGEEWYSEWSEDMQTLPHLVEVNIVTKPPSRGSSLMESFIVNLTRSVTTSTEAPETDQTMQSGG
jgi:general secretion pathway protein J